LRAKYDPQAELIPPHLTLLFPLPGSVGEQRLVSHIEQVVRAWKPFSIRLKGLQCSRDNYLLLLLQRGKREVIRLHEAWYTGVLAPYRRTDLLFVPHVTLGAFPEEEHRCLQAVEEAQRMGLDYRHVVDRLDLVEVNNERTQITRSKEFKF
jgi:2'-5' RNA ligase